MEELKERVLELAGFLREERIIDMDHKFMNHNTSVRYFNELISTNGFDINARNLVMTMINSIMICLAGAAARKKEP